MVVSNVRGVRGQTVKFRGKSLVVCGPNGTGKSSLVDALDFLLTGKVRRLEGEGAGGLSVAEHGKHVDAIAEDTWVQATFSIGSPPKLIHVKRTLKPSALEPASLPEPLAAMFQRASELENHLLSRREILTFILAAPKRRRELVADLLRASEIDKQRAELSAAAKQAEAGAKKARAAIPLAKKALLDSFEPPLSSTDDLLARVNASRKILGGQPLADFRTSELCEGVYPPSSRVLDPEAALEGRLQTLADSASLASLVADTHAYLEKIDRVNGEDARLADKENALLSAADHLLQGDECPLCGKATSMTDLRKQWAERLEKVRAVSVEIEACRTLRGNLATRTSQIAEGLRFVKKEMSSDSAHFASVSKMVEAFARVEFEDPLKTERSFERGALSEGIIALQAMLDSLRAAAPPPTERSRADVAWSELQAAAKHAHEFDMFSRDEARKTKLAAFLTAAEKAFISARDEVLDEIYSSIAARVEQLYAKIHTGDGKPRKTSLNSTKTGLEIEVDFYGRGGYPPAALHSEGQQDTLGICLFLALAERSCNGPPPLLILDDVLMSVDAAHRRKVAEVLRDEFKDTQFLITTHDEVWAKHLTAVGVTQGRLNFDAWSIDGSSAVPDEPRVAFARMREDIENGRIPTAAHTLRRAAESFLPDICDALGASVRYKADGKYDQGSFIAPTKTRFSDLLKEAIKCAKSWGDDSTALEAKLADYLAVREQLGEEDWAVNTAVHFNPRANMTAEDITPVVDAYERFFAFFYCESCGSLLRATAGAVQCGCKKTVWNLEKK